MWSNQIFEIKIVKLRSDIPPYVRTSFFAYSIFNGAKGGVCFIRRTPSIHLYNCCYIFKALSAPIKAVESSLLYVAIYSETDFERRLQSTFKITTQSRLCGEPAEYRRCMCPSHISRCFLPLA